MTEDFVFKIYFVKNFDLLDGKVVIILDILKVILVEKRFLYFVLSKVFGLGSDGVVVTIGEKGGISVCKCVLFCILIFFLYYLGCY